MSDGNVLSFNEVGVLVLGALLRLCLRRVMRSWLRGRFVRENLSGPRCCWLKSGPSHVGPTKGQLTLEDLRKETVPVRRARRFTGLSSKRVLAALAAAGATPQPHIYREPPRQRGSIRARGRPSARGGAARLLTSPASPRPPPPAPRAHDRRLLVSGPPEQLDSAQSARPESAE